MATVDEVTGNGPEFAETVVIHTLQLLERICTRDERVENVTDDAGWGSATRTGDTAGNSDTRRSEIKRELG